MLSFFQNAFRTLTRSPRTAPTRRDVVNAYRLFLGRDPESEAMIEQHIAHHRTVWSLIRAVESTPEAKRYRAWKAAGVRSRFRNEVDIAVTPEQFAQMTAHIERVWTAYGNEDPFYSVLSDPKYRAGQMTETQKKEFYRSGASDVEFLKLVFERNGLKFPQSPSICELGCGLGRVSGHLAPLASRFTGVDISPTHLDQAKAHVASDKASFVLLGDYLKGSETFDLFFSVITLQHNPPPVMAYLLENFLGRINRGGFAYFQIPGHLYDYSFSAKKYLAGKHKADFMEMHALPQRFVFPILHRHGLRPVEVFLDESIGPAGHSYQFLAQKD